MDTEEREGGMQRRTVYPTGTVLLPILLVEVLRGGG